MGNEMGNNKSTLQEEDNPTIEPKDKSSQEGVREEDVNPQNPQVKGVPKEAGLIYCHDQVDDHNQNTSDGRDEDPKQKSREDQAVRANDVTVQNDIIQENPSEDVDEKKTEMDSGYLNGVIDHQVEKHIISNEKEKEEIPNGEVIQVKITGRENSIDILSTSSPDDPGDYQKIQDSTLEENQSDTNDHQFDKQIPVKKDDDEARKSYSGHQELQELGELELDQTELGNICTNQSAKNGMQSGLTSTSEQNIGHINLGEIRTTSDLVRGCIGNIKLQTDSNDTINDLPESQQEASLIGVSDMEVSEAVQEECLIVFEKTISTEKESETRDSMKNDEIGEDLIKELKVETMSISDNEDNNNFKLDEAEVPEENLAVDVAVNKQISVDEDAKDSEDMANKNKDNSQEEGKTMAMLSHEKSHQILLPHQQECSGDPNNNFAAKAEKVKDRENEPEILLNETKVESTCGYEAQRSIKSEASNLKVHPQMQKSPSFCFDLRMEERSEESDQTPLLFKNKAAIDIDQHTNKYQDIVPAEEKVVTSETSTDSDKSRTPFLGFLKEEEEAQILVNAINPENNPSAAAQKPIEEASPALPKLKEKRRVSRSTLFGTCMCCASVIN